MIIATFFDQGFWSSISITIIGVTLAYGFTIKKARSDARAEGHEQAKMSRQLSLSELQDAFDTMYRNDLARWDTLHDFLLYIKASDDFPNIGWKEGVEKALNHLENHKPENYHLVDPEFWQTIQTFKRGQEGRRRL